MHYYNHWSYLRINDYTDIYKDPKHPGRYIMVECEPFGWSDLLTCTTYEETERGRFRMVESFGAPCNWIETLKQVPIDLANEIYYTARLWACPDCSNQSEWDFVELDEDDRGWVCPKCGCHTEYPLLDACFRI